VQPAHAAVEQRKELLDRVDARGLQLRLRVGDVRV
jgi:hypothetical protein